jgi:hypothetical protein
MKLLIKFPTRNRPTKFLTVLKQYIQKLEDKETKIIVSCDNDDESMKTDIVRDVLSQYKNVEIKFDNNKSKIDAINSGLNDVDFDILLLASDDMVPLVNGYDTVIKEKMRLHYADTDGVLWFNDGHQEKKLNTLCILGKKYYDRFVYIYHPDYLSVWCDNEFMDVANILNKQTYFEQVIIEHKHPDWGFGGRDIIHVNNTKNENKDKTTYLKRKSINFEL